MKPIMKILQMNLFKKFATSILLLSFFPMTMFAGINYSKYDAIFLSEGEEVLKCTLGAIACFLVYFILHKLIYKNTEKEPGCIAMLFHTLFLLGGVILLIPLVSYLQFFFVCILLPIGIIIGIIALLFSKKD